LTLQGVITQNVWDILNFPLSKDSDTENAGDLYLMEVIKNRGNILHIETDSKKLEINSTVKEITK